MCVCLGAFGDLSFSGKAFFGVGWIKARVAPALTCTLLLLLVLLVFIENEYISYYPSPLGEKCDAIPLIEADLDVSMEMTHLNIGYLHTSTRGSA
jgi:hypothetical protein